MASGQTTNYGLNQWAENDPVLRTEFNEDNVKIDTALKTILRIATGRYTGNGTASTTEKVRTLNCGFPPQLVLVMQDSSNASFSGIFVRPCICAPSRLDSNAIVRLTWGNLDVSWESVDGRAENALNSAGSTYCWWAIG